MHCFLDIRPIEVDLHFVVHTGVIRTVLACNQISSIAGLAKCTLELPEIFGAILDMAALLLKMGLR